MGSKKKRTSSKSAVPKPDAESTVNPKPDMSKYAGATSNKSKRNYSDINLKLKRSMKSEHMENSDKKQKESSVEAVSRQKPAKKAPSRSEGASKGKSGKSVRNTAEIKEKPKKSAKKKGSAVNKSSAKKKNNSAYKAPSKPAKEKKVKKPQNIPASVEYREDEYAKALNSSDFYSSIVEKYYIKHPDEKRTKPSKRKSQKHNNAAEKSRAKTKSGVSTTLKGSVAEIAVKGRGTKKKAKDAVVVKKGKAKGIAQLSRPQKQVHKRNRRSTLVSNATIILAVCFVMIAVYATLFFKVKNIKIMGTSPYTENEILSVCNFTKGQNILLADTSGSIKKINESLPYIEKCTISRRLPATLVIKVDEAHILGMANTADNSLAVLSTQGRILCLFSDSANVSASDVIPSVIYNNTGTVKDAAIAQGIPILEGLDLSYTVNQGKLNKADAKKIDNIKKIIEKAKALNLLLTGVAVDNKEYTATYGNRIKIRLGDISDEKLLDKHLKSVQQIVCPGEKVSDYEHGEILFIKEETHFIPTYEKETEKKENKPEAGNEPSDNTSDAPENGTGEQSPTASLPET